MPSPIKATAKSFKEKEGIDLTKNKFEESKEESMHSMEVPPLEKLTVDLTNDTEDSSDTNNKMDDEDEESAASLTLSHKENKSPNDKQEEEEDDEDSDVDSSDDEDESDEDDDDELYVGMSKEQIAKMKAAMGGIKDNFEEQQAIDRQERIKEIQNTVVFNLSIDVSDEQALFIDEFVTENHYNLEEQLQDEGVNFLASMKEMMEQKALLKFQNEDNDNNDNHNYDANNEGDYDFGSDDDEDWVANEKRKKAKRAQKRKGVSKNTNLDGSKRCGRLLLNDALKNPQDQSNWSEARKKAWKNRKTAQNAYFYRFNVPGQPQKNGKWSKAEHELFMKRVLNFGVNDKWGIYSKAIPGRVGYQCSNYWRGLVKDGDVTDPNYFYDGKKLHFKRNTKHFKIKEEYKKYAITINKDISGVWKPLPKKHPLHPSDEYCREVREALAGQHNGKSVTAKKKNKKRKRGGSDSDDEYEEPAQKKRRRRNNRNKNDDDDDVYYGGKVDVPAMEDDDNPLPDFRDIITGSVIVKPAISPYGHVLGYDTWTKILRTTKQKNTCPFTWQKMTRRGLIKLTKDNFDQYKDKMVNITEDQLQIMSEATKDN